MHHGFDSVSIRNMDANGFTRLAQLILMENK